MPETCWNKNSKKQGSPQKTNRSCERPLQFSFLMFGCCRHILPKPSPCRLQMPWLHLQRGPHRKFRCSATFQTAGGCTWFWFDLALPLWCFSRLMMLGLVFGTWTLFRPNTYTLCFSGHICDEGNATPCIIWPHECGNMLHCGFAWFFHQKWLFFPLGCIRWHVESRIPRWSQQVLQGQYLRIDIGLKETHFMAFTQYLIRIKKKHNE